MSKIQDYIMSAIDELAKSKLAYQSECIDKKQVEDSKIMSEFQKAKMALLHMSYVMD